MAEGNEEKKIEEEPKEKVDSEQKETLTRAEHESVMEQRLKEQYDKLNAVLSEKGAEIQKLKEGQMVQPPTSSMSPTAIQIMLDEMKAQATELGQPNPRIAQLEAALTVEKRKEAMRMQYARQEQVTKGEKEKIEEKFKAKNLDPNDEAYADVWDAFELARNYTGDFDIAHRKADRILKKAKPKEEEEAKEKDASKEEMKRKIYEEEGLLKSPSGGPSGATANWEEVRDAFIKNPSNPRVFERYNEMRKQRER